jgi:hypothetical protein
MPAAPALIRQQEVDGGVDLHQLRAEPVHCHERLVEQRL